MMRDASKQINKQPRFRRKKALIIGCALLAVIIVAGLMYVYFTSTPQQREDNTEPPQLSPNDTIIVASRAREFIDNNNPQGGIEYFDERLADASDENKYDLLIAKLDYALLIDDIDQAIEAGLLAVKLRERHDGEAALARAYEQGGQTELAVRHYQRALQLARAQKGERFGRYNLTEQYEGKIQELAS